MVHGEGQGRHLVALRGAAPNRTGMQRTVTQIPGQVTGQHHEVSSRPSSRPGTHTHTTHIHIHTQKHFNYRNTHIHINIHTHTNRHSHILTHTYTYIHTHTSTHIYTQAYSHTHTQTYDAACGSAQEVRRLLVGTQPTRPTESMLTAGRRQAEPPGEGQVHSHHKLHSQAPPSCLQVWTWGRAWPPLHKAWTGPLWSHSLALPWREEGTGWLHRHWDLLDSTGTVPLARKHFCPSAQNHAHGCEIQVL